MGLTWINNEALKRHILPKKIKELSMYTGLDLVTIHIIENCR
jgi:hypothetical protein